MEPNAVPENCVEVAGDGAPNAELLEVAPKGLGLDPPVPKPGVELNGELVVAEIEDVVPNVAVFSPPLNMDVLDVGAVVADDVDGPLDTGAVEAKGDLLSSPVPCEAVMFPKPNDVFADDGGFAFASDKGLDVLYFCASLANISGSLPLYFSKLLATSGTFCALCFS